MINSTSKTDPHVRPEAIAGKPSPAPAPQSPETDRLSAASQESLQAALRQQPEIRPDVVALGQKLAVDADYPPMKIIQELSKMLIAMNDLSEKS
jgi:hypothetical protein